MNFLSVIVGLGNIGDAYKNTRHNVGFLLIDAFLEELQNNPLCTVSTVSLKKVNGLVWRVDVKEGSFLLCKPSTYMNNSGVCVLSLLSYYSIPPTSLLVLHDELDIALGFVKLKCGGGDAGHNGLRSITSHVGVSAYNRLRIGIGRPSQCSVTDWVLGKFSKEEFSILQGHYPFFLQIINAFIEGGFEKAQNEIKKK